MKEDIKRRGLAPGTVVFTGSRKVEKVFIHHLQYDSSSIKENTIDNQSKFILEKNKSQQVDWYDVRGMHDVGLVMFLGDAFEIHPLIQESIVDIDQRPKFEEYAKGVFIVLRSLKFDSIQMKIQKEHVAIYFNKGFIVTFQETESDLFEQVRKRIQSDKSRIRQRGSDYLAYALIDGVVDNYYTVIESFEVEIEQLEDRILTDLSAVNKNNIHRLKRELLVLRKSIAPLREAIANFSKTDNRFVDQKNSVFIRNLYENTIQIMDTIDSYMDVLNGLQDLFITEVSFKMNKVMQLLTVISVIFIPLTFLAGIYGMNFEYIPELQYKNGYFILLGVMIVILISMIFYFKKKKWL